MTPADLKTISAAALAILVVAACGTSTGPSRSQESPGTGTSTLRVVANIDANDDPASGAFSTVYFVSVRDGAGFPVSGATVTISNPSLAGGKIILSETFPGSGDYQLIGTTFPNGAFGLDVVQGANNVHGVTVGRPTVHTITTPVKNATVAAEQPLLVRWTVGTPAKSARIDTKNFGPITFPDTGAYQIPGGVANPARTDQRIRVFRFNEVVIAGGLPGSAMRVTVRRTVEPIIVQ